MRVRIFVLLVTLTGTSTAAAVSLKAMYDLAPPGAGYDKDIVLETGVTYTGGADNRRHFQPHHGRV